MLAGNELPPSSGKRQSSHSKQGSNAARNLAVHGHSNCILSTSKVIVGSCRPPSWLCWQGGLTCRRGLAFPRQTTSRRRNASLMGHGCSQPLSRLFRERCHQRLYCQPSASLRRVGLTADRSSGCLMGFSVPARIERCYQDSLSPTNH